MAAVQAAGPEPMMTRVSGVADIFAWKRETGNGKRETPESTLKRWSWKDGSLPGIRPSPRFPVSSFGFPVSGFRFHPYHPHRPMTGRDRSHHQVGPALVLDHHHQLVQCRERLHHGI